MQYARTVLVSNSSGKNPKPSTKSLFAISFGALAITVFLLHSTLVMAGDNKTQNMMKSVDHQLVLNETEYGSRVAVNSEKMTAEKKPKSVSKDNIVGSFSMEDGAREGFYGDGEYAY